MGMKNRWIALYVENQVGVLAKVSGLFSAKCYNLQSLTVGTTEHEDVSRMTICVTSDDITFEQIKKQLNWHGGSHQGDRPDACAFAHERDPLCQGQGA